MQETWILFDLVEATIGIICMAIHIDGFMRAEALPHNLLFCGTYFGFPFRALFCVVSICVGLPTGPSLEFIVNSIAAIFYYVACMYSMHLAEIDIHLIYLTESEEIIHPFFYNCRFQSIFSLIAASFHLLHAVLAADAAFLRHSKFDAGETDVYDASMEPIRLYFLGRPTHMRLAKLKCFNRLMQLEFDSGSQRLEFSRFTKSVKSSRVSLKSPHDTSDVKFRTKLHGSRRIFDLRDTRLSRINMNLRQQLESQLEAGTLEQAFELQLQASEATLAPDNQNNSAVQAISPRTPSPAHQLRSQIIQIDYDYNASDEGEG